VAGVRAAVLHRQCGGRAWTLILRRGRTISAARALLASLPDPSGPSGPSAADTPSDQPEQ